MLNRTCLGASKWAGLALLLCITFRSWGAITSTGDTSAAIVPSQDTIVGNSAAGTLTVDGGSFLYNYQSYVGKLAGSTGVATVSGASTHWWSSPTYIGHYGSGTLNVDSRGLVETSDCYLGYSGSATGTATVTGIGTTLDTSYLHVGEYGTGAVRVLAGATLDTSIGYLGYASGSGLVVVNGAGSKWKSSNVFVGAIGTGTLRVEAGGLLAGRGAFIGDRAGSRGSATITGTGSKWTFSDWFLIGDSGTGVLTIDSGGQVVSILSYLGYRAGSTGTVQVTGAGSTWTNSVDLYIGDIGTGALTVSDGGKVTTKTLSINPQSIARLHVSGNGMMVLGNSTSAGSLSNEGTIALYADAFLANGTYTPILPYAGQTVNWSGAGTYRSVGGSWDGTSKTLGIVAPTAYSAGVSSPIFSTQRLLMTNTITGRRAGASFGNVPDGATFSATPIADPSQLQTLLGPNDQVLEAWDYSTTLSNSEVLLSYEVGQGMSNLSVWNLQGGGWVPYAPSLMTYDANGVLSFTTSTFGSYALVNSVPEPGLMCLISLPFMLLGRRNRRKIQ